MYFIYQIGLFIVIFMLGRDLQMGSWFWVALGCSAAAWINMVWSMFKKYLKERRGG